MTDQSDLLVESLQRLNRSNLPYMLTGSMATSYWGNPRTTNDLDFVLMLQPVNVQSLVMAFETGFFLQPESVRRAFSPPHEFNAVP